MNDVFGFIMGLVMIFIGVIIVSFVAGVVAHTIYWYANAGWNLVS